MAEALAKLLLPKHFAISSAGINTANGMPASQNATAAMKMYELDITKHLSRQINHDIIKQSDLILTMTSAHKQFVDADVNVNCLSEFACGDRYDIIDPFGQSLEIYKRCADELYMLIKILSNKLN